MTPEQGFAQAIADRDNIIRGLLDEVKSAEACYEAREEEAHQLSERIIKLIKERDEYKLLGNAMAANHKECVRCLGEALQDRTDVAVERDELQKQVDDFCMAYRMKTDVENKKLVQERDALAAAAKLALEALGMAQSNLASSRAMLGGYTAVWDKYADVMNAIRRAGVQ